MPPGYRHRAQQRQAEPDQQTTPPEPVHEPPVQGPPAPSGVTTDVLDAAEDGFGGDTSSGVGEVDTSFDSGTALQTVNDLSGGQGGLYLGPDGNGGWTVWGSATSGPISSTGQVTTDEDGTTATQSTEVNAGFAKFTESTSIGREVVNGRWTGDESTLAWNMMRMVGGSVDVVGMQDKVSLNAGFSTNGSLPVGFGGSHTETTGHDAYHFLRSDGSELTEEEREERLGADLADMDGVTDFGLQAFEDMVPGEGFAFVDDLSERTDVEGTARRGMGPVTGSLTVGFGSGDRDLQQTMITKTDDSTVRISLTQGDGDMQSSRMGIGVSRSTENGAPGGFSVNASVGTQVDDLNTTQVTFDIDVSTPEGQEELQRFTTTGLLPGANRVDPADEAHAAQLADYEERSAALAGMDPESAEYAEAQAELFAISGELNNQFVNRDTFREQQEVVPEGVTYNEWLTQQEQTVTHSASFWAWQMSRVGRVEREWDRFAIQDGAFDLEAGFYQDTEWTEGDAVVVASPNSAPGLALGASSRTDMGVARQLWEDGLLPEGALDPALAQAVFQDGLDDFNDGGMQITTALTDEQMALLAEHGGDAEALLNSPEYLPNYLTTNDGYEHGMLVEHNFIELMGESTDETEGYYSDEELLAFQEKYGDENNAVGRNFLAATQDLSQEQFNSDLTPIERELLVETRAQELLATGSNPWEVLSLVETIPDEEERTRLHRELFETIENTAVEFGEYGLESGPWTGGILGGDAVNSASALLMMHMTETAKGLDPAQAEFLMSGIRLELVDQRASDWANDRILDPLESGQDQQAVLGNLIDEHINWSIEHEDYDQLSDNFQAVSMAGGADMVNALVTQMGGEAAVAEILNDTYADDPRRLAIYGQVFAGTPYAAMVEQARTGCLYVGP